MNFNGLLGTGSDNGVNNLVNAFAVSGSDLYVGGVFGTAGGQTSSGIAKWTPDAEMIFASGFEGH